MNGKNGGDTPDGVPDPGIDDFGAASREVADSRDGWSYVPWEFSRAGARSPEELEMLFEDALLIRDREALADLFAEGALLTTSDNRSARGGEAIARLALATLKGDESYVADPHHIVQARDTALMVAERSANVLCRSPDGFWRYAIVLMLDSKPPEGRTHR